MLFYDQMLQLFACLQFTSLISKLKEENIKMTRLKTVVKWGKSLECELEKIIKSRKIVKVKCKDCIQFESGIKNIKGFNQSWIDGTGSVKKDSLEKHLSSETHKYAKSLSKKKSLGSAQYHEEVIKTSAIAKGITKMNDADKEVRNKI